jgi:hypothetical protein
MKNFRINLKGQAAKEIEAEALTGLELFFRIASAGQHGPARHHFLHSLMVSPHQPWDWVALVNSEPQSW